MAANIEPWWDLNPCDAGLPLLASTALCLGAVAELAHDTDIPVEDLQARFAEYAACAAGRYSPEVAFDPIAIELRRLAAALHASPWSAGWARLVEQLMCSLLRRRLEPAAPQCQDCSILKTTAGPHGPQTGFY